MAMKFFLCVKEEEWEVAGGLSATLLPSSSCRSAHWPMWPPQAAGAALPS